MVQILISEIKREKTWKIPVPKEEEQRKYIMTRAEIGKKKKKNHAHIRMDQNNQQLVYWKY